jgi:hypothetical protein
MTYLISFMIGTRASFGADSATFKVKSHFRALTKELQTHLPLAVRIVVNLQYAVALTHFLGLQQWSPTGIADPSTTL